MVGARGGDDVAVAGDLAGEAGDGAGDWDGEDWDLEIGGECGCDG